MKGKIILNSFQTGSVVGLWLTVSQKRSKAEIDTALPRGRRSRATPSLANLVVDAKERAVEERQFRSTLVTETVAAAVKQQRFGHSLRHGDRGEGSVPCVQDYGASPWKSQSQECKTL